MLSGVLGCCPVGLTSCGLSMCLPARPVSGVQQKRVKKALEEQEKAKQAYIEGEKEEAHGHSLSRHAWDEEQAQQGWALM